MAEQQTNTVDLNDEDTPKTADALLWQYSAEMETVGVVARMAANELAGNEEAACALYLVERELDRFCRQVGEVAETLKRERKAPRTNGLNSEIRPMSRTDMARDLCRTIRGLAIQAGNSITDEDLSMKMISIEKAAEALDSMVSDASTKDTATVADIDRFQVRCDKMPEDQVAFELRGHQWEASEIMAASMEEDGYRVTKTFTRRGLAHFLAEREYLQSLLPDA